MTVIIRPGEASLDDWRAIWRGEPMAVDASSQAGVPRTPTNALSKRPQTARFVQTR